MKPVNATPPLPYPSGSRDVYGLGAFDQDLTRALHSYLSELAFRLNGTLPKDGTEPMTGILDMGGFAIINTPGGAPGDVFGPASATDNNPAVFDGTTGKLIKEVSYATFKTSLSLTKSDVGLSNVDNTSDLSKPVSTATQTALDLKADLASPALTGNPTAPTASPGDNDTSIATTAFVTAANPDASTTTKGHVELATNTETGGQSGGTDTTRAVTPDDLSFHSGRKETRILTLNAATTTVLDIGTNWVFIELDWSIATSADDSIGFQVSFDNGSSYVTTANSHTNHINYTNASGTPTTANATGPNTTNYFPLHYANTLQDKSTDTYGGRGHGVISRNEPVGGASYHTFDYQTSYVNNNPALIYGNGVSYLSTASSIMNALRILAIGGATVTGWVKLEIYYI